MRRTAGVSLLPTGRVRRGDRRSRARAPTPGPAVVRGASQCGHRVPRRGTTRSRDRRTAAGACDDPRSQSRAVPAGHHLRDDGALRRRRPRARGGAERVDGTQSTDGRLSRLRLCQGRPSARRAARARGSRSAPPRAVCLVVRHRAHPRRARREGRGPAQAVERACDERAVEFGQMVQYPAFTTIASEPRFQAVMRRVNLPR